MQFISPPTFDNNTMIQIAQQFNQFGQQHASLCKLFRQSFIVIFHFSNISILNSVCTIAYEGSTI